ncbi:unnamed protein product [Penicillium discolor]
MHDIENTLIGTTAAGLSVEQCKRLTIGVELVSKPSILIFLDEPTSGLDGQAVLVTIHQPSASLFAQFDTLLLLAKGGKTVYFGNIGHNGATVKEYFGRNGAPCPQNTNPPEHMIDVVSGSLSVGKDWNEVWLASPEYTAMTQELDYIIMDAASKPPGTLDDGHEFATPIWTKLKLSAFTTGLIVSELPYLVLCAVLYYVTWYYTVGFPSGSDKAGAVFFVMLMYEFIYTGSGQAIGAYAPNAVFAILVNPLVIGVLVSFCNVYVPYSQIQEFWLYWLYYLNPFNYLMGSMLVFTTFDAPVHCGRNELAVFNTPDG